MKHPIQASIKPQQLRVLGAAPDVDSQIEAELVNDSAITLGLFSLAGGADDGVKGQFPPSFGTRGPCGFKKGPNAAPHGGCMTLPRRPVAEGLHR